MRVSPAPPQDPHAERQWPDSSDQAPPQMTSQPSSEPRPMPPYPPQPPTGYKMGYHNPPYQQFPAARPLYPQGYPNGPQGYSGQRPPQPPYGYYQGWMKGNGPPPHYPPKHHKSPFGMYPNGPSMPPPPSETPPAPEPPQQIGPDGNPLVDEASQQSTLSNASAG